MRDIFEQPLSFSELEQAMKTIRSAQDRFECGVIFGGLFVSSALSAAYFSLGDALSAAYSSLVELSPHFFVASVLAVFFLVVCIWLTRKKFDWGDLDWSFCGVELSSPLAWQLNLSWVDFSAAGDGEIHSTLEALNYHDAAAQFLLKAVGSETDGNERSITRLELILLKHIHGRLLDRDALGDLKAKFNTNAKAAAA